QLHARSHARIGPAGRGERLMTASFNLVTDRWIPCTDLEGRSVELGIRETLINAHQLRSLATSAPMVSIPILRLLLCVLHRVFGPRNENEWFYLWQQGRWDEHKLHAYLDEWQHRFELFGDDEEGRFYQVK